MDGKTRGHLPSRLREQSIRLAGQPVANTIVEHNDSVSHGCKGEHIAAIAKSAIGDRIRNDGNTETPENADRPRHMPGGGHEQPAFSRLWMDVKTPFSHVLRDLSSSVIFSAGTPNDRKKSLALVASACPSPSRAPNPPVKTRRAAGSALQVRLLWSYALRRS
jgi:hypothetical protein